VKTLIVFTSHDQLGDTGKKTGFWLEEFAAPYYVLKDAGAAGSLAIVLLWVYYAAQILFFGARFNQLYSKRHDAQSRTDTGRGSSDCEGGGPPNCAAGRNKNEQVAHDRASREVVFSLLTTAPG
jgi:hypothetical protein